MMLNTKFMSLFEMLKTFNLIDMTATASIIILVVLIVRLLLVKLPKRYTYVLWVIPLFRLLIPFSVTSRWSLLSGFGHWFSKATDYPISSYGGRFSSSAISSVVLPSIGKSIGELPSISATTYETFAWNQLILLIWMIGVVTLWGYYGYKTFVIKKRLATAKPMGNNVYLSDRIETPFVFGLFSPRIILPEYINEDEKTYILAHERIHIKRFDSIWRVLAFIALSIHWFNPLVWISYFLSAKDMERSCDEAVIRIMGSEVKKAYSTSLLKLSAEKSAFIISPVAFGESDTKGRIKNILQYKKPSFWIGVLGIVLIISLTIMLLTNPKSIADFSGKTYEVEQIVYDSPIYSFTYSLDTAPIFTISSDMTLFRREKFDLNWGMSNGLKSIEMNQTDFDNLFMIPEDHISKLLVDNAYLYRADVDDEAHTFYLIMQQKNGDLYLTAGYDNEGGKSIRWIFKLKEMPFYRSVDTLYSYRTKYIGDNSKVGNIISYFAMPSGFDYDYFELKTKEEPYGLIVHLKAKSALRAGAKLDSTIEEMFSHNAQLALSLIENAKWVEYEVSDGYEWKETYRYERTELEATLGVKLWNQTETLDDFINLLNTVIIWE
ncbi:hypothetical protein JCM19376_33370 [Fusibacter bizertensis]